MPDDRTVGAPDRQVADRLINDARAAGRTLLTEHESKALLKSYGIPTVTTEIATTVEDAVRAAEHIGYPVVLKLHSNTITHKTDVGGVKLNLGDAAAVKTAFEDIRRGVTKVAGEKAFDGVTVQLMVRLDEAYELIVGASPDPQFGPVLLFGTGGQLVEVFKDRGLALPPLNATLARRMMEQTKIYRALQGVRGRKPVDLAALEHLMVRFSQLVVEQRWIKEIDINPLIASSTQLLALDARVVLHDSATPENRLPKPAIRPYPVQYVRPWKMGDGTAVTIRPIRPEDEPLLVQFHQTLSDQSVQQRYFAPLKLDQRTSHERLTRVCFNDYDRELALVVDRQDPASKRRQIIAVGRLSKTPHLNEAEVAVLISDVAQGRGLGTELVQMLVAAARDERVGRLVAYILPENQSMLRICRKLDFRIEQTPGDTMLTAVRDL